MYLIQAFCDFVFGRRSGTKKSPQHHPKSTPWALLWRSEGTFGTLLGALGASLGSILSPSGTPRALKNMVFASEGCIFSVVGTSWSYIGASGALLGAPGPYFRKKSPKHVNPCNCRILGRFNIRFHRNSIDRSVSSRDLLIRRQQPHGWRQ